MGFEAEIAAALGSLVRSTRPLGGGDINDAYRVELEDGRAIFAKANRRADPTMFEREAAGLRWLAEPDALRIPEVLAAGERWLALELIEPGRKAPDHDERLGRGLAALHRAGADGFGWPEDNFIGSLPQENAFEDDWPTFYWRRRLEPQLRMASDAGRASSAMKRGMERLRDRLEELCGEAEPPARLHGDLWGGNAHVDAEGAPVLIDPAVYGGHREIDLAMMRLFGGFSARVFAAYEEAWPLAASASERVSLYQLYPLMVHVNLFGGGYVRLGRARALVAGLTLLPALVFGLLADDLAGLHVVDDLDRRAVADHRDLEDQVVAVHLELDLAHLLVAVALPRHGEGVLEAGRALAQALGAGSGRRLAPPRRAARRPRGPSRPVAGS